MLIEELQYLMGQRNVCVSKKQHLQVKVQDLQENIHRTSWVHIPA